MSEPSIALQLIRQQRDSLASALHDTKIEVELLKMDLATAIANAEDTQKRALVLEWENGDLQNQLAKSIARFEAAMGPM